MWKCLTDQVNLGVNLVEYVLGGGSPNNKEMDGRMRLPKAPGQVPFPQVPQVCLAIKIIEILIFLQLPIL